MLWGQGRPLGSWPMILCPGDEGPLVGEQKVLSVMFLGPSGLAVKWHLQPELGLRQENGIGAMETMLVRDGDGLGQVAGGG